MLLIAGASASGCARENTGKPSPDMNAAAGASAGTGGVGGEGASPSNEPVPSAGDGGASGSTPDSGRPSDVFMPRPPPDPDVEFEWPEALPGGDDVCQPGTYTGDFFCVANAAFLLELMPPEDGVGIPVLGPVTLTFERSMDGEFLEIKKGLLEGLALEAWGFVAELEGRLDCDTLELEATASSGVYGLGLPVAVPQGTFGGTLNGKLNPMTRQLEGAWALVDDFGVQGCNGPWTASHTP
jgi:hypothetical protein